MQHVFTLQPMCTRDERAQSFTCAEDTSGSMSIRIRHADRKQPSTHSMGNTMERTNTLQADFSLLLWSQSTHKSIHLSSQLRNLKLTCLHSQHTQAHLPGSPERVKGNLGFGRAETFVRVNPIPEAFMSLLAASAARSRLHVQSANAHIVSHRRLLAIIVVRKLPIDMVRAAHSRPSTLWIAACAAQDAGELAAAAAGAHARAPVDAVVVAGGVWLDCDGPVGAELAVAVFVEDEPVHDLALRVDVQENIAEDVLAFAAVELVEGEVAAGVAA